MRLVPLAVKRRQAGRLSREQFHALGLDQTRGRTGILLFVSVAERYVEILADRGIDEKVPPGTWKEIVAAFTPQVREGKIADGFVGALTACGALLISHFPRAAEDRNELPDVLIEL
jgi:putative membrane protein